MGDKVYTLQTLAEQESVSYGYLRLLITRLTKAGKPLQWKDYRFEKSGGQWLAVLKDSEVEIV